MKLNYDIPKEWGLSEKEIKQIFDEELKQSALLRNEKDTKKRRSLYKVAYDEYFKNLPFHPQFTIKSDANKKANRTNHQVANIAPFINENTTFVEIGAGDCSLSLALENKCKKIYALEVSEEIVKDIKFPKNIEKVIFNGFDIPLETKSIDIAYSNQLMEHLHPEDAVEQTESILRILKKGGAYICLTPNKLLGPHDISRFYSNKLQGFHLKEYSVIDLKKLFLKIGFSKTIAYSIVKGKKIVFPYFIISFTEFLLKRLPIKTRKNLASYRIISIIINATTAAIK